jgi:hypothetical protein
MDAMNYLAMVRDAFEKMEQLQKQRESLEAEIMKLEQFISATANFLPDEQRDLVMTRIQVIQDLQRIRDSSLTEAARRVLAAARDWLTTTQVRDKLMTLGFDFSLYTTNPLASISTTLRRMTPHEVESKTNADGTTVFHWKEDAALAAKMGALSQALKSRKPSGPPPPPRFAEIAKAQKK